MGSSCLLQFAFTRTRISVFGSSVASFLLCVFYDRFCALLCFALSITYVEASDDDFRETTFFFTKESNMLKMEHGQVVGNICSFVHEHTIAKIEVLDGHGFAPG